MPAEIPKVVLYDEWLYKTENDDDLCLGYLKLRSDNFKAIAYALENHPTFKEFIDYLIKMNVPANDWIKNLKIFLWESDYC